MLGVGIEPLPQMTQSRSTDGSDTISPGLGVFEPPLAATGRSESVSGCLGWSMNEPSPRDLQTYAIIGAAMEVHRHLGPGFLEAVYREALRDELDACNVPFQAEVALPVHFKGRRLSAGYRADFLCFGNVMVELKALGSIGGLEAAQVLNYLKISGCSRGLLLNFGAQRLQYRRFIWSAKPPER